MTINFLPMLTGCFAMPAAENRRSRWSRRPTAAITSPLATSIAKCRRSCSATQSAARAPWAGLGSTARFPHKVAVIGHLDGLGESAALIGAVNTVVRRDDTFIGENTDGREFVAALRTVADPAGARVVMFGAGGAARAVGVELALAGASRILVVNRGRERAEPLVELLNARTDAKAEFAPWPQAFRVPKNTDIVINATSIGLYPGIDRRLDLDLDSLAPSMVVADLIPNPPRTLLLTGAAERGCRTLDGLGMLVNQGVIGIKYWTGLDVDPKVMRTALAQALGV